MEHLMACRVCLATDVKLYEMSKYRLNTAYEDLTGMSVSSPDFPRHVCSYCAAVMHKYTLFRDKCARSQHILEMLAKEHITITTSHIKTIDRHSHRVSLPYTVYTQNFDSTDTIQNFDSTVVTTQNFDPAVTIKYEIDKIKTDNNDDDYNYDCDNDTVMQNLEHDENVEYSKLNNKQYDSDEEPLSKKMKKKRKKHKTKPQKNASTRNCNKIGIKSEIDPNFAMDVGFPTNDVNFPTNNKNFPAIDENFPATDENIPISEQNVANQLLDVEKDHKLVILSKTEQLEEVLSRKTSANYLNSLYKCELCFKGFMTEATFNNHMARHDPSCGPAVCPVCATRWADARALRAHTLISHERRYICKVCGHTSKSSHKAKEHSGWHAGVTFACECGRAFRRSTSYLTHLRLRHATTACALCGQSFIGENGLRIHRKKAHRDEAGESSAECGRCRVRFRHTAALERHRALSDGACDNLHACAECGDHFSSDQLLKEHEQTHKSDAHPACPHCSRTFASERSLGAHIQRAHARTHARDSHCVCEICGYKCMSGSSLVNHQRVHSGEKPHACLLCHKRFSVAQRLQIHIRTHTNERPFQCSRCPKAFKHKAALNRHDRVHTGVKPYCCPQCGKSFSQSNSMKQHCAGVHMKTAIYSRRNRQ